MIKIRPQVAMYDAFRRLNYKAWYALSEFVDNSLQSYLDNIERLQAVGGNDYQLTVEIDIRDGEIEIRDNAAGIHMADYSRAFLPATPPPDRTGLSEYGLGMKAAACWFSQRWSVRTTALGEDVERTVAFDVPVIVREMQEELHISKVKMASSAHYTCLILRDLNNQPRSRTITKIRTHLASIYRLFLNDGTLKLVLNGESLAFKEPKLLVAPHYKTPKAEKKIWKREFRLELDDTHVVSGWAGILEKMSPANAGFALFRRKRLIVGSLGDAYRPPEIFGAPNMFKYRLIVGELQLEGFGVSHTKDGLQWEQWEQDIIDWLKTELDSEPTPLLSQAHYFRKGIKPSKNAVAAAARHATEVIGQRLAPVIDGQISTTAPDAPIPSALPDTQDVTGHEVTLSLDHARKMWRIRIEFVSAPDREAWYEPAAHDINDKERSIVVRINLAHPFMLRFQQPSGDELNSLGYMAAALCIAEETARTANRPGALRRNLNEILRAGFNTGDDDDGQ